VIDDRHFESFLLSSHRRLTELGRRRTSDRSQIVAVDHFMIMGTHLHAIAADLDQIVSPILA
jgi:DhnA family fructose-bisphosphate aldolase class Ia